MRTPCNVFGLLSVLALAAAAAEFTPLSEKMILFENNHNRVFALNTARGIVVIDTASSVAAMAPLKALIEDAFKRTDYACVINTHPHPEHIGGNALFPATWIVAEEGAARGYAEIKASTPAMLADTEAGIARAEKKAAALPRESPAGQEAAGQIARGRAFIAQLKAGYVPPNLTFRDRLTLDLGDRTVVLIALGKGHSWSDCFVYVPEDGVLLTGGRGHLGRLPPGVGFGDATDIDRYIAVLGEFVDSPVELRHILSGHNPPATKADLKFIRDYFRATWEGLKQAKAGGQTLDAARQACALQARFGDWPQFARPTDAMVKIHHQNLEAMWAALQRSPEPAAQPRAKE